MSGWYAPSVPAILGALVRTWQQWPDLAGVEVKDGPSAANAAAMEVLAVGWAGPAADTPDANGEFAGAGLGLRDAETYTVHNTLAVLNANVQAGKQTGDLPAARARAMEIWTAAMSAVYFDRTLGGAVAQASAAEWEIYQALTDAGMLVRVMFSINVRSFTGP